MTLPNKNQGNSVFGVRKKASHLNEGLIVTLCEAE
jgi:hypothetical protein